MTNMTTTVIVQRFEIYGNKISMSEITKMKLKKVRKRTYIDRDDWTWIRKKGPMYVRDGGNEHGVMVLVDDDSDSDDKNITSTNVSKTEQTDIILDDSLYLSKIEADQKTEEWTSFLEESKANLKLDEIELAQDVEASFLEEAKANLKLDEIEFVEDMVLLKLFEDTLEVTTE